MYRFESFLIGILIIAFLSQSTSMLKETSEVSLLKFFISSSISVILLNLHIGVLGIDSLINGFAFSF